MSHNPGGNEMKYLQHKITKEVKKVHPLLAIGMVHEDSNWKYISKFDGRKALPKREEDK